MWINELEKGVKSNESLCEKETPFFPEELAPCPVTQLVK